MKKVLKWIGILGVIVGVTLGTFYFIYVRPLLAAMMTVTTIHVDPQFTIVLGGGGNSGVFVGDSAVLVIDTKMDKSARALHDSVQALAGSKPIYVVNTHVHNDHSGGNNLYKGATIIAGGDYDPAFFAKDAGAENVATQWVKDSVVINLGGETATIVNMGNAHTQSDVMVYLHNHKTLFGGDVILNQFCPALFKKYNADPNGYMKDFDVVQKRFDIKTVVPGHGPTGGAGVVDNFRQFFKDMQAIAADGSKKDEMEDKYKSWGGVPFFMSTGATVSYIRANR